MKHVFISEKCTIHADRRKGMKLMVVSGNTAIALEICHKSRLSRMWKCESYCNIVCITSALSHTCKKKQTIAS